MIICGQIVETKNDVIILFILQISQSENGWKLQ